MPVLPIYRNQLIDLHMICTANQLTGFYMRVTPAFDVLTKLSDWFLYKMQHWAEIG